MTMALTEAAPAVMEFLKDCAEGGDAASDVVADPSVPGVFGVRRGDSTEGWIVYTDGAPWDFEEVEFGAWPPRAVQMKQFDAEAAGEDIADVLTEILEEAPETERAELTDMLQSFSVHNPYTWSMLKSFRARNPHTWRTMRGGFLSMIIDWSRTKWSWRCRDGCEKEA